MPETLTGANIASKAWSDFDAWQHMQSNVMLAQDIEHQAQRYHDDKEWHCNKENYRSKA